MTSKACVPARPTQPHHSGTQLRNQPSKWQGTPAGGCKESCPLLHTAVVRFITHMQQLPPPASIMQQSIELLQNVLTRYSRLYPSISVTPSGCSLGEATTVPNICCRVIMSDCRLRASSAMRSCSSRCLQVCDQVLRAVTCGTVSKPPLQAQISLLALRGCNAKQQSNKRPHLRCSSGSRLSCRKALGGFLCRKLWPACRLLS